MVASVALMAAFVMGIVFSIIGALKLELAKILKIDNAKVGGLISALMFTTMILVLVIGPLVDIFGHKPFAVFGYIVVFIGAFLLIAAKSYRAAVFACVLMGIGGTCLTTIGNLLMTVVLFNGENPPAALNLGNTFFGLGAFFAPFAIGILLRKFGYKVTGNVIAFILLIPVIFAVAAHGYPDVMTDFQISQAFGLLKKGIVIMCALTLFCYVGLEISMGSWISSYASGLGFSNRSSNLALS
ncbi:MFS transporter, partial [bacterium]|nr:MFS transporter [bacterium]